MKFSTNKKVMGRLLKKKPHKTKTLTLRQFHEKRNSVLILRSNGGLGDILVHRMMFEDFKRVFPECNLVFACPKRYHDAVIDHPFIDEVVDCETVNAEEFIVTYNTTSACCRYEMRVAPNSGKNRSDIWANHCGVPLKNHNMHINLEEDVKKQTKLEVEGQRDKDGPSVLLAPVSAMQGKNLLKHQIDEVVDGLRDRGLYVFSTHTSPIREFVELNVPTFIGNIRRWMGYVYAADYVVSVDTSTFHLAGGINKPLVGIFTFCDGKVYGKYYDFELVQKHRDNGDWSCGPCYNWPDCSKQPCGAIKPCLTEITPDMILEGIDKMLQRWPL